MVQSISKNWLEETRAKDQNLLDLKRKYPDMEFSESLLEDPASLKDFRDIIKKGRFEGTIGASPSVGYPKRKVEDAAGVKRKIVDQGHKRIQMAVRESIDIREKLKNPKLSDSVRGRLENRLTYLSRLDTGSRGGTKEMQAEMEALDSREDKKKSRYPGDRLAQRKFHTGGFEEEEEVEVTFKDRLRDLWEDGSKRNAILSGISETLLETRVGADAYGNRFRDLPGNVSDKMMQAEALDMVKDQAILDMIKTQAETQAAIDPKQFLSNTQKNARDFATAQGHVIGSKEWNAAYAGAIQEMTMENLLTAPAEGIAAISEMLAKNTGMFDDKTIELFKDVIAQLTDKIRGEPAGKTRSSKTIIQGGTG